MADAFWTQPVTAADGRLWRPLGPGDLTEAFLETWQEGVLFEFIAALGTAPTADELRHMLFVRHSLSGWRREGEGPVAHAYLSTASSLPQVGVYIEDPRARGGDGGDEHLEDWLAGLDALCAHLFAQAPALDFLLADVARVVADARHEGLLLRGWEVYGGSPSRQPQRACYRLTRAVHALYAG